MENIYTFTLPLLTKSLSALDTLLSKAEAFAKEKGLSDSDLLNQRLAPDMFPFKKQVQVACDNAKGAAARLSGTEAPVFDDTEETFAELHARIQKTQEYLNTFTEGSFKDGAERQVTLPYFPAKYMTGFDYAREYVLPNFFFHVSMAYAILRKEGAPIGKADYMGGLPLKDL
jgi:hypothetical protein